jgi:hypothetical protein
MKVPKSNGNGKDMGKKSTNKNFSNRLHAIFLKKI